MGKGNYEWLADFFYDHMSTTDYEDMISYTETEGGFDEAARNKAQEDYLNKLFLRNQVRNDNPVRDLQGDNPREVSQRKGVATMIKKLREKEETGKKNQIDWLFAYNRLEPEEAQGYSSPELKKLVTEKDKTTILVEKDEQQLADSIIKEFNKATGDDKAQLRDFIKRGTGFSAEDIRLNRDLLIEQGDITRNELKRVISDYNKYKRADAADSLYKEFEGSPEWGRVATEIKQSFPKLSDDQVYQRVFARFKALHSQDIERAGSKDFISIQLLEKVERIPDIPNLKKLSANIRQAQAEKDLKALDDIKDLINSYKTKPSYANRQNELEKLFNLANAAKLKSAKRITTEPSSFARILHEDVSGREVNELTKGLSDFKQKSLRMEAEKEVSRFIRPGSTYFDAEVNRRIIELLPGASNVEEKLKLRMGVKDERDFVSRVANLTLDQLESAYGTDYVGDRSKAQIIDDILTQEDVRLKDVTANRRILMGLGEDEILSMAASDGLPVFEEDKITRSELKAIKAISKKRAKRFTF